MDIIAQARKLGDDRPEREVVADVAASHGYRLALCRFDGDAAPAQQSMFSRPAFIAVVAVMVLLIVAFVVLKRRMP